MRRGRVFGNDASAGHLFGPGKFGVRVGVLAWLLFFSHCARTDRDFSEGGSAGMGAQSEGSQTSSPPSTPIQTGATCVENGLRICAGPSQKERLLCVDGLFENDAACSATENCDELSGSCLPIVPQCRGRAVGFRFCDAAGALKLCGLDLVRAEDQECDGTCLDGRCVPRGCGDGVTTPPEQCDDGNAIDSDQCTNKCTLAACGDRVLQASEACDDGNAVDNDACVRCQLARCGDGVVGPGEACDDGNAVDNDACSNRCRVASCGDGAQQANEACDDGNAVDNDACSNGCKRPVCGDKIVQAGEACDDGNTNDADACSNTCTVPGCGDGSVALSEECDDGNPISTDGCTVACKKPKCGDSFIQAGEECDDGNASNEDGCTSACRSAQCGDGFTQRPNEECDDGNSNGSDGCTNACRAQHCGDGIVQTGEECDDGNLLNSDLCTTACKLPECGDGILSTSESCEDGNRIDGDGCSSSCKAEVCGDSKKTGIEQCDDGNRNDNDGCSAACRTESCGDGVVQPPRESCEDKNTVDTDLCRTGCKTAASLNALNGDCQSVGQITQTVCMVGVSNWCKQFNLNPVAGMVTGQKAENEYTVACIAGLTRVEVNGSLLEGKCPGGKQQSPACLERAGAVCRGLGAYGIGFYVGAGATSGTTALACGTGTKTATESVPGCNGIVNTNPVPVQCAKALADKCGSGKGGMIQALAQSNQVTYTCVNANLTGSARLR